MDHWLATLGAEFAQANYEHDVQTTRLDSLSAYEAQSPAIYLRHSYPAFSISALLRHIQGCAASRRAHFAPDTLNASHVTPISSWKITVLLSCFIVNVES